MDTLSLDGYTSYSDSSTPRTPSPRSDHMAYATEGKDGGASTYWTASPPPSSRGSLLSELYDQDPADVNHSGVDAASSGSPQWQQSQTSTRPAEYTMMRRATFPYVRQDHHRDDALPQQYPTPFMPPAQQASPGPIYGEPLPMSAHHYPTPYYEDEHAAYYRPGSSGGPPMHHHPHHPVHHLPPPHHLAPMHHHTLPPHHHRDPYPHPHLHPHPHAMPGAPAYLSPHTGLPVQHTDDAASKETQYLRRRCFNCHTTEPPSWRRSTLNPGKIVCNKCGLYERTHLRPRPLRFDELRAGNKARKQAKAAAAAQQANANGGAGPTPSSPGKNGVKREPGSDSAGPALTRRSSVSSVHSSNGAQSDWDDSVSIYSTSSSAPPHSAGSSLTSSPSSIASDFPRGSHSPPMLHHDAAIRLPSNPLSDIMHHGGGSPQIPWQHQVGSHQDDDAGAFVPTMPGMPTLPMVKEEGGMVLASA